MITITDITKELGITRQTLNNWEMYCDARLAEPTVPKFPTSKSCIKTNRRLWEDTDMEQFKKIQNHIREQSAGKGIRNDFGVRGIKRNKGDY